ncbi:UNVERIFIED_CONTAM: acyl-phosphate glycerol 3-phosphate acyltransferase [Clostridioides difficile]|uniref:glycerol-3-phosphate 1-O-acyltransferase PlsY n=1 Tax=Clostridioides difficile TaxID=1496 RepID=UPI000826EC4E|nr:glycerol-3-phosphate 1-O-acyltransferase PlsY [Clostridioides difficile]MDO0134530.1 glycerol-3-phosphate 1-O-acyltransferase PlsY [Clostridioides difficile]MDX5647254.1 glycerol-3-phosphate 1-O-acyltransferase PlsY [Clostridioides difficile]MEC5401404.1 glycerol-3-phosphate 1-O-acyltransferase PlsY [Clostridioides difficile]OYO90705.1 acyl-phosphate glycerol 3-phosphate acyltransferase [Clostridioides difficile]HBG7258732.1 glycerol-3-phosphate 1-O-acyltransferase PlsY [Clostridioides diff
MEIFSYIIIAVVAYLLGNISTSYIVAKRIAGVDIRTQGSGNAGSTNVLRTLGKRAGAMTFLGDVLKGVMAVLISEFAARLVGIDTLLAGYLAVICVVAGHNWPAVLGFRGGKGVATSLGAMLAVNPVITLMCLAVFILVVAITKYVSLGSVVGIGCSPIFMIMVKNKAGLIVALFLTASVIYNHRANIKRLLNGTERKIGKKKE